MTYQRRRGQRALVYVAQDVTDSLGNHHREPDLDNPIEVRAAFSFERSNRAEVPGQQQVNVINMVTTQDIPGIDMWGRVWWNNSWWDIESPPAWRFGSRHVRHLTIQLRERPHG